MYRYLIKPIFFLLPPERAHEITMYIWKFLNSIPFFQDMMRKYYGYKNPLLKRKIWGLDFQNPVGLAAGFDKDGRYYNEMSHLGFGFIEIGTVTPKPQEGNPQPRLFRLPEDEALINRMGFNNHGAEAMAKRLKNRKKTGVIIGGNIGKNKSTSNENAIHDYVSCLRTLYDHVDYFVVNVSSPNTPGLRELQDKGPLMEIMSGLKSEISKKPVQKPILLKIAPDITDSQLDDIIEIVLTTGTDGIIATNTTIKRDDLHTDTTSIGAGGLSGKPLTSRSTEVIRYLHTHSKGNIPIIGVGGISSPKDVIEKLEAGAVLVQIYTGLIYEGPGLVKKILKEIVTHYKN
ncbi:MAG: quinone-dependent dihydroorotate dehydrogenase [Saprospiraceae bacterium]|nr:quinone-dependent dihydroorotate dehydrogenase [Saprospiraceae bacterium]